MCMSRPCALTCTAHVYAFRYMPPVIYLGTYIGLPYIPKSLHIQVSRVEALTESTALRRKACRYVASPASKSRPQTVWPRLKDSALASMCLDPSRNVYNPLTEGFPMSSLKNPFEHLIKSRNPPPPPFRHFCAFSGLSPPAGSAPLSYGLVCPHPQPLALQAGCSSPPVPTCSSPSLSHQPCFPGTTPQPLSRSGLGSRLLVRKGEARPQGQLPAPQTMYHSFVFSVHTCAYMSC